MIRFPRIWIASGECRIIDGRQGRHGIGANALIEGIQNKKVVVIGATGLIGSYLVARLEELTCHVYPLSFEGYPLEYKVKGLAAKARPIMFKPDSDWSPPDLVDAVINLHWQRTPESSLLSDAANEFHRSVIVLERFLLNLRDAKPRVFVDVSSIQVFGKNNQSPVEAHHEPRPDTAYGLAKLMAEKAFEAVFRGTATQVRHLRLCSVYGHGSHHTQLVSRLCASAYHDENITLNVDHKISLLHVDEVVDLVIASAFVETDRDRFLLTSEPIEVGEVARQFEKISNRRLKSEQSFSETTPRDVTFVSDRETLASGWTRQLTLREGLAEVAERASSEHIYSRQEE